MMEIDKSRLIEQLERHFRKICPAPKNTKMYSECKGEYAEKIADELNLRSNEEPVIYSSTSECSWFVITTERIVWKTGDSISWLPKEKISDATVDMRVNRDAGVDWGTGFSILTIISKEDQRFDLEVEPGYALNGLIASIKRLGRAGS